MSEIEIKDFQEEVNEKGRININTCFQCNKCSAGCPVSYAMDYSPHALIRMIQMGMRKEVLESSTIWICASCETCSTRCPNEVDIARLMDTLRQISIEEKGKISEKNIKVFLDKFLSSIESYGRVHELGLITSYKLNTWKFFEDALMGGKMLLRGKLSIFPHRIKGMKEIKELFKKIK
jgi:heterodisulfide reductase subunit C